MTDSQAAAVPVTPPENPPAPPKPAKIKLNRITYDGKVGKIYGIWLLNFFMKIITIGIYSFWGKTRLRKYVASSFTLANDRFEYTGTGKELFLGFLKALPIIIAVYAPFIIAQVMAGEEAVWPLIFLLPLIYVVPMAIFLALRYRMSRTTWRGIRGALSGSAVAYANLCIKRSAINVVTLGVVMPYSDVIKHKYIVQHAYFGNVQAKFNNKAVDIKSLMKLHLISYAGFLAMVLGSMVPVIGPLIAVAGIIGFLVLRLQYSAAFMRAKMNGIVVADLRFKNNVTAWDMVKLYGGNFLILILTLGLGTPFAINRQMKFIATHNAVGGDIETAQIMQAKGQPVQIGEGLDDVMGLDGGFL